MPEFTGQRVIPGKVDPDLWNEHFARYAFAARLARQKRVLDIACGSGYGSAELAKVARSVTGIDVSEEAVAHAEEARRLAVEAGDSALLAGSLYTIALVHTATGDLDAGRRDADEMLRAARGQGVPFL